MDFTDGMKKIFFAGVGLAALTAEKSKEVVDDLVKKGTLTVEQGKVLNEELKHRKEAAAKAKKYSKAAVENDFSEMLSHLTPEQLQALKEQIVSAEKSEENTEEKNEEATASEENK